MISKFARTLFFSVVLSVLSLASIAYAQDFANGVAAFEAGNYEKAIGLFEIAANDGHLHAQIYLGTIYAGQEVGGDVTAQNHEKSLHFFQMAAEQGNAPSQFKVGEIHAKGLGKDVDYSQATYWYQLAASQGDPNAQNQLWQLYATGTGVEMDNALALMWIMVATYSGNVIDEKMWDDLVLNMTQDQLTQAENFAKTCIDTNFGTCGY